jgi:hypothetical protein
LNFHTSPAAGTELHDAAVQWGVRHAGEMRAHHLHIASEIPAGEAMADVAIGLLAADHVWAL